MKIDRSKFKPTPPLVLFRDHIKMEFFGIKNYLIETKDLIHNKQKELKAFYVDQIQAESLSDIDEARKEQFIGDYIDDMAKYDLSYMEYIMNSTFTSAYSLFENTFRLICYYSQVEKGIKGDLPKINYIHESKNYIEKDLGISLSSLNSKWEELQEFKKVRNLIIHNASNFWEKINIPLDQQDSYLFIVSNTFIQIKKEGRGDFYIKDQKFIIGFCNKVEEYLLEVITNVLQTDE